MFTAGVFRAVVKRVETRTGVMVAVEGLFRRGAGVYGKRHGPSRVVRARPQSGSCCQRRYCLPPRAVRAARPGGACHRGVGRGREREDTAAAVVARRRGLTERAAWVSVQPEERDAQRFWLSVLDALRELTIGEVAAVTDQCTPRALTGICHRSGPCSCLLYRSRLRDPRRTSGRLSAGGGPLSFPGRGACGHEFPLGELILVLLSLDVGVGDGPGEPPRVVPDP